MVSARADCGRSVCKLGVASLASMSPCGGSGGGDPVAPRVRAWFALAGSGGGDEGGGGSVISVIVLSNVHGAELPAVTQKPPPRPVKAEAGHMFPAM